MPEPEKEKDLDRITIRKPNLISAPATSTYGAGTGGIFSYMIQWAYMKLSHGDVMPEAVAIGLSVGLTWFFVRASDYCDKIIEIWIQNKAQKHLNGG